MMGLHIFATPERTSCANDKAFFHFSAWTALLTTPGAVSSALCAYCLRPVARSRTANGLRVVNCKFDRDDGVARKWNRRQAEHAELLLRSRLALVAFFEAKALSMLCVEARNQGKQEKEKKRKRKKSKLYCSREGMYTD